MNENTEMRSVDLYWSASRIINQHKLTEWRAQNIGYLATFGLVRYEQRGYFKIYYVPDVLKLYEMRNTLQTC